MPQGEMGIFLLVARNQQHNNFNTIYSKTNLN